MNIQFATKKLEEELNSFKNCKAARGFPMAKKIEMRLQQAHAADCLEDLRHAPGKWHELHENREGQFGVSLVEPQRLIFKPVGDPADYTENGTIVWKKIFAIEIIEITNYHGR